MVFYKRALVENETIADLDHFWSFESRFVNCTFSNISGDVDFGTGRHKTEYVSCTFDRLKLRLDVGGACRFVDSTFTKLQVSAWFGTAVDMVRCTIDGTLRNTYFNGVNLQDLTQKIDFWDRPKNEFVDNDFSRCAMIGSEFRSGIDLRRQTLPTGEQYEVVYRAAESLEAATREYVPSLDPAAREDAESAIRIWTGLVDRGQHQLFICPLTRVPKPWDAQRQLVGRWMREYELGLDGRREGVL